MRLFASCPALLYALCALAFVACPALSSDAAESQIFIIAASDGYGVQDCLGGEGQCGQVVADAWCEAHGHGTALAFGKTDDVTGAIAAQPAPKMLAGAYFITCRQ
jgi:hypothetical protein